jgi:hypothetical protein
MLVNDSARTNGFFDVAWRSYDARQILHPAEAASG